MIVFSFVTWAVIGCRDFIITARSDAVPASLSSESTSVLASRCILSWTLFRSLDCYRIAKTESARDKHNRCGIIRSYVFSCYDETTKKKNSSSYTFWDECLVFSLCSDNSQPLNCLSLSHHLGKLYFCYINSVKALTNLVYPYLQTRDTTSLSRSGGNSSMMTEATQHYSIWYNW